MTSLRLLCSSLLLAGWLGLPSVAAALDRAQLLEEANLLLLPRARPLPAVELVDQHGEAYRTDALGGRWHLMFVGFTFCPDICPTTLSELRRLLAGLPDPIREQIQVTLVSVDPRRDSPERLKTYLGYYRAGFEGVTGELAELKRLTQALGLPFTPADGASGDYSVAHSANVALIDPAGRLVGHLRAPLAIDALQKVLPEVIDD
ncbi:SCO family protein [Stutzerimonas urumqiensis]|uniref:SCO family protein n=1 Tax=Stutzerimonas urumqiensis TaxID=638269 RepID=UPI003BAA85D1